MKEMGTVRTYVNFLLIVFENSLFVYFEILVLPFDKPEFSVIGHKPLDLDTAVYSPHS